MRPLSRTSRTDEAIVDRDLIDQVVDGSEDALARLYDRHATAVFAEARRASGDLSIAAEAVQETFLALWNRAEQFDAARGDVRGWLLAIAHNRAVDHLRHARRHDPAVAFSTLGNAIDPDASTAEWVAAAGQPIAVGRPDLGPEAWVSRDETRTSIASAVASLAPLERSVIALAYDGGLSQSEIAVRLGWPIGTVKTRTRSALRHLRERLERSHGDVRAHASRAPREQETDRTDRRFARGSAASVCTPSPCGA